MFTKQYIPRHAVLSIIDDEDEGETHLRIVTACDVEGEKDIYLRHWEPFGKMTARAELVFDDGTQRVDLMLTRDIEQNESGTELALVIKHKDYMITVSLGHMINVLPDSLASLILA